MESNNTIRSSREEMFALIEKYFDSSQPQKQFCIDNTITLSKFTYWLKKYRNDQKGAGFIPLNFSQAHIIGETRIELPNGIIITFNASANTTFIGELIMKATL